VAWGVHEFSADEAQRLRARLGQALVKYGLQRDVRIKPFTIYGYGLFQPTPSPGAFVLYFDTSASSTLPATAGGTRR
jgi:hypothetical protein